MMDYFSRVQKCVSDSMGIDIFEIELGSRFIEDLRIDSLDKIELTFNIEEEFGIEVTDEMSEGIRTVGDVVEIVRDNSER